MEAFRDTTSRRTPDYVSFVMSLQAPGGGKTPTKGLSAEAKLAWIYLYRKAGGIQRTIVVHAANVASKIGATHAKSGLVALQALEKVGFIRYAEKDRGQRTVYLNDPLEASIGKLVPVASDDQPELDFGHESESPPEDEGPQTVRFPTADTRGPIVAQSELGGQREQPAVARQQDVPTHLLEHLLEGARASGHNTSRHNYVSQKVERPAVARQEDVQQFTEKRELDQRLMRLAAQKRAEDDARSVSQPDPIATVAPAVEKVIRNFPTPEEQIAHAEKIVTWLTTEIADAHTKVNVLRRVAWAIAHGKIPEEIPADVIRRAKNLQARGLLRKTPAAYFIEAMKNQFFKRRLTWNTVSNQGETP